MENNYCIIMAGGVGSRFWPYSRTARPKQFLDFLGTGRSLLQMTFDRFAGIVPTENIYIVSNQAYRDLILEQLPELRPEQVLLEPLRRNTAPCIAYAVYKIKARTDKANILVVPSDHLITKEYTIGDFVLTGGEMPAAMMTDAIVRLLPGAIGDVESALNDSFQDGLLEPGVYTRPADYKGWKVPEILLSGNQRKIEEWLYEEAVNHTRERRPDLLEENGLA